MFIHFSMVYLHLISYDMLDNLDDTPWAMPSFINFVDKTHLGLHLDFLSNLGPNANQGLVSSQMNQSHLTPFDRSFTRSSPRILKVFILIVIILLHLSSNRPRIDVIIVGDVVGRQISHIEHWMDVPLGWNVDFICIGAYLSKYFEWSISSRLQFVVP